MVTTPPPMPRRHGRPTRRARRLALVVVVVLVALGGLLLAGLTREPLRAAVWQRLGQPCGTVGTELGGRPLTDSATAQRAEACFMDGYAHCRAVSLDDVTNFIDGHSTHTFVVEPALGPLAGCAVADALRTVIVGSSGAYTRTERCAGVVQRPDGLHVLGCGPLGDITVGGQKRAAVGLLIKVSFIATFTQRLFGSR